MEDYEPKDRCRKPPRTATVRPCTYSIAAQAEGETNSPDQMDAQLKIELSIVNEVNLVYRTKVSGERPVIISSASAYDLLLHYFDEQMETREVFYVLMLDRGNRAKCVYRTSEGGMHGTVADPKLIFAAALKCMASSIILAHNHPSGQLRPSEEDIRLTRKLLDGGRLLDIAVHDHVIMARSGYYSFADNGML